MTKRGQAALEFLMTYGWAILAAVVVVGVLWYMIGNPANLAGNDFQVGAPFVKGGMNIDSSGTVQIEIRNGGGNSVNVTSIRINPNSGSCAAATPSNVVQSPGNITIYTINCSDLNSGDKLSGDITINYIESGSSLVQTAKGTIRAILP